MSKMVAHIVGQRIVDVRRMTEKEAYREGWPAGSTVLVLGNGILLYPSQDAEGNGPGAVFGATSDGVFTVPPPGQ